MGGVASGSTNRFIYGAALFIGWLSAGLGIVGGIVQICGTMGDDDEDDFRIVSNYINNEKLYSLQY